MAAAGPLQRGIPGDGLSTAFGQGRGSRSSKSSSCVTGMREARPRSRSASPGRRNPAH
jgi:hypothetical protein